MGVEDPGSRLSNGQFAKGRAKGQPRNPRSGRKPGTPNKATRAVREFLAAMVDDAGVQEAIRERILAGDAVAFFRAVDQVLGKPRERMDVTVNVQIEDRLKAARNRLAQAKHGNR